jgi:autotransporter-associated beta strand protein
MKTSPRLRNFLLAAGSYLLAVSSAHASTWDGDTSANWSDAGNWDAAPTLTGDNLIFSGTLNQTNTNDAGVTSINSLTLNGANWNTTLGTLSIGSGGISASGNATLGGTLTLGAAQSWTNTTGTVNVNGTVNNGGNLLTVGGAGNTTINSAISGTGGLRKIDAGVLNLGDSAGSGNDYSGGFTLDGGVVQLATAGTLNTAFGTGTLTINSGTIRTSNGSTIVTNNNSVWNGITSLNRNGSGTGTWIHNGNMTLNASIAPTTTAGGFVLDVRGNIGETGGPRSITVGTRQTMIFSGDNTYTGNTTVTGGTSVTRGSLIARSSTALGTGGTRTVTVGLGAALTYAATANAALSITDKLTITGGTNSGATTTIGTSIGSSFDNARIAVTGAATISNAAHIVNIYGVNGVSTRTTGTYTLIRGGTGSTLNLATAPTLGTIYNNTNFAVGAFSRTATELNVAITSATALTAAYWTGGLTGNTSVWAASSTTASNWVTALGGGATALVPGPDADVVISATTVSTAPTATTLGADMTIKSLTISDNTNNFALNTDGYALTVGSGGITKNNSTPKTATIGANLVLGAAQTWSNSDTTNALTVSGTVSGANNLTVTGAGTITLSGTNTYTGGTTVSAGTLTMGNAGALGSPSATLTVNGGSLNMGSQNLTVGNLTGAGGTITGTSGDRLLTIGQGNATGGNYQGVIENGAGGTTALTKTGTGTLTLSGNNTYTGATTVSQGTLIINGSNASTSVSVAANASLSGSGSFASATLGGSGSIDPGNSPGIQTSAAVDPSGGLDFNFEFTAANTFPDWDAPTASVNDVLRLTHATVPIIGSLDGDNLVNIYLNVGSLTAGQTYTGGFYTDLNATFLASITGADFNYFLLNASGAFSYNGFNYDAYTGPLGFSVATIAQTADFDGAGPNPAIDGYVTQFTVAVPEPGAALLGGMGFLLLLRRRR